MRPLGPAVQPLEGVVVEARREGEPPRECAGSQGSEGFGPWHLVHVGYYQHVAVLGGLAAAEVGEDLGEHAVALQVLHVPGGTGLEIGRVFDLVVDDLGVIGLEVGEVAL